MEDQTLRLSQAYNNRANTHRMLRNIKRALEDTDQCIALREQVLEQQGRDPVVLDLARAYANKMLFLMDAGDPAQAALFGEGPVRWLESLMQRKPRPDLAVNIAKISPALWRGTLRQRKN